METEIILHDWAQEQLVIKADIPRARRASCSFWTLVAAFLGFLTVVCVTLPAQADMGPPWLWINGKWTERYKTDTPPPSKRPDHIIPGWESNDPNDPNPVPVHPEWAPGGKYYDPKDESDPQKKIVLVMLTAGALALTWDKYRVTKGKQTAATLSPAV